MKEINLLPQDIAFNYKKFVAIRLFVFVIILNIILLFSVSFINIRINKHLNTVLSQKKAYLSQIENINSTFLKYKKQYKSLKQELVSLKNKIRYYEKTMVLHRSAYTDSIVFLNTFFDNVWFDSVSYNNGYFSIKGYAPSKAEFQKFFSSLGNNRYISDIKFFYIRKKDDKYVYKINYRVVFR